jgi:hypothetical protein
MRTLEQVHVVETGDRTIACHAVVDDTTHVLGPLRLRSVKAEPRTVRVRYEDGTEREALVRDVDLSLRRLIWLGAVVAAVSIRLVKRATKAKGGGT